MKKVIFSVLLLGLLATACSPAPNVGAIEPPYIETGLTRMRGQLSLRANSPTVSTII